LTHVLIPLKIGTHVLIPLKIGRKLSNLYGGGANLILFYIDLLILLNQYSAWTYDDFNLMNNKTVNWYQPAIKQQTIEQRNIAFEL
jgi:hypothetical protein